MSRRITKKNLIYLQEQINSMVDESGGYPQIKIKKLGRLITNALIVAKEFNSDKRVNVDKEINKLIKRVNTIKDINISRVLSREENTFKSGETITKDSLYYVIDNFEKELIELKFEVDHINRTIEYNKYKYTNLSTIQQKLHSDYETIIKRDFQTDYQKLLNFKTTLDFIYTPGDRDYQSINQMIVDLNTLIIKFQIKLDSIYENFESSGIFGPGEESEDEEEYSEEEEDFYF